jgi:hypothetical protein
MNIRYKRALSIKNSSILDFDIINEEPLFAYMTLQGSSSNPYHVIIDCQQKIIKHYCPDFAKENYEVCKHVYKLLIDAGKDIDEIQRGMEISSFEKKISGNFQKDILKLKNIKVFQKINTSEDPETQDLKFDDLFKYYCTVATEGKSDKKLEKRLSREIREELSEKSILHRLHRLAYILDLIPKQTDNLVIEFIITSIENTWNKTIDSFLKTYWQKDIIYRLEIIEIIDKVAQSLNLQIDLTDFKLPANYIKSDIYSLILTVEFLFKDNYYQIFNFLNIPKTLLRVDMNDFQKYLNLVALKMRKETVRLPKITRFIRSIIDDIFQLQIFNFNGDEFLIYIIEANKETPQYQLSYSWNRPFVYLPNNLLQENPALRFVIDQIKESDREYLTNTEIDRHSRFFDWLGSNRQSNWNKWKENPRDKIPDVLLNSDGIIFQWKLNVKSIFPERYNVFDGNQRYIINQQSAILNKLQPFDYTFSEKRMNKGNNTEIIANPKYILTPDQVINCIYQGFTIISDVLPWNSLEKYAKNGYVSESELLLSIKKCEELQFIYGSIILKKQLQTLLSTSKLGISDEQFVSMFEEIKKLNFGFNVNTKQTLNDFITMERENFSKLTDLISLNPDDDKFKRMIINSFKTLDKDVYEIGIENFRKQFIMDIFDNKFLLKNVNLFEFIAQLKGKDLGSYDYLKIHVISVLTAQLRVIEKDVTTLSKFYLNEQPSFEKVKSILQKIQVNPIGKCYLEVNGLLIKDLTNDEILELSAFIESFKDRISNY